MLCALLALPVEFAASKRGLALLRESKLFASEEEAQGARKVLTAAALTYVAAFTTSVLQFLCYIRVVNREADQDRTQEARRRGNAAKVTEADVSCAPMNRKPVDAIDPQILTSGPQPAGAIWLRARRHRAAW